MKNIASEYALLYKNKINVYKALCKIRGNRLELVVMFSFSDGSCDHPSILWTTVLSELQNYKMWQKMRNRCSGSNNYKCDH